MEYPIKEEDFLPMDFATVWEAMEECQRFGLTKSIGVGNFYCNKLQEILDIAKIPPAVNQVEVNPCWLQKKLREFCKDRGILVVAYSTLGSIGTFYGTDKSCGIKSAQENSPDQRKDCCSGLLEMGLCARNWIVGEEFQQIENEAKCRHIWVVFK